MSNWRRKSNALVDFNMDMLDHETKDNLKRMKLNWVIINGFLNYQTQMLPRQKSDHKGNQGGVHLVPDHRLSGPETVAAGQQSQQGNLLAHRKPPDLSKIPNFIEGDQHRAVRVAPFNTKVTPAQSKNTQSQVPRKRYFWAWIPKIQEKHGPKILLSLQTQAKTTYIAVASEAKTGARAQSCLAVTYRFGVRYWIHKYEQ